MYTSAQCSGCGNQYTVRAVGANPVLSCPACGTRTFLKLEVTPPVEPPPVVSQVGDKQILTAQKLPPALPLKSRRERTTESTEDVSAAATKDWEEDIARISVETSSPELLDARPSRLDPLYEYLDRHRAIVLSGATTIILLLSVALCVLVTNAMRGKPDDIAKEPSKPAPTAHKALKPVVEDFERDTADEARVLASMAMPKDETAQVINKRVQSSIVTVKTNRGFGSGFVIDDDTVATNYHVIEGARYATISFRDGDVFDVIGYRRVSTGRDLAILVTADRLPGREPLPLRAGIPEQGEKVLAFGSPIGLSGSLSEGLVSAIRTNRELSVADEANHDAIWIQTTCAISQGNSGGPLVDMQGRVVGINTFKITSGESLNFAISSKELRNLVREAGSQVHPLSDLPAIREDRRVVDARERKRIADEESERERGVRERRADAERLAEANRRREALERMDRAQRAQATQLELTRVNDRIRSVKSEITAIEIEGTNLYAIRGQTLAEGKVAIVRWNQIAFQVNSIQARLAKISNAIGMRRSSGKYGPTYTDGENASWDEFGIAYLQREAAIRQSELTSLLTEGARLEAIKSGLDTKFDLLNGQIQYKERQRAEKRNELQQLETQYQELSGAVE